MRSIKIMIIEHENITRMLKVLRNISYRVLTLGDFELEDIYKVIDFIRNYADKHHHGKEEDILFETMNKKIEKLAKAGAITGMYIEHDMGRLYMINLEKALERYRAGDDYSRLDIIANAISYTDLLERHMGKENAALYKFAENMLDEESKVYIEKQASKIEELAKKTGIQEKYLAILQELEKKYN